MKEYYLWQRPLIAVRLKTVHRTQEFFSHNNNQETVKMGLIQPVLTSEILSRNEFYLWRQKANMKIWWQNLLPAQGQGLGIK